jgi:TolB-like protein/DNA-binding winged helix-turn-helix (wHTH) protein
VLAVDTHEAREVIVRFGVFEADLRTGELRKQGLRIKLQEQPFQILQILLERPGEVVTREDVQQKIWPADTFVDFDHGLNNAIRRLREALGDTAETPRFIETLPKRGYRFIAPVNGNDSSAISNREPPLLREARRPRFRWPLVAIAATAVIGLSAMIWRMRPQAHPEIHSLAVLPLQSLAADPAQEYFAEGMTDALITDLAQISSLKVVSRTTIMRYRRPEKTLRQVAQELNVDGIVEGTVQRSGDFVRITAQLVYGPTDQHLWANSYEREVKDMLTLQSIVAGEIVHEIRAKVTPAEQAKLKSVRLVNPKALDAYVEAQFHLDEATKFEYYQGKTPMLEEELRKAISFLDRAVREDSGYIPAYVAYFNAVDRQVTHLEFLPKAKAALQKGLELDDTNLNAHLAMGKLYMRYEYDWAAAEKEYKRALELNPNSADAHNLYSEYLNIVGRNTQSDQEHDLAQALDPAHDYSADYGVLRIGTTLAQQRQVVEEQAPNDPDSVCIMGKNYAIAGRFEESVEMYERCLTLLGWDHFASVMKRAAANGGSRFALEEWMRSVEEYSKTHDDIPVFAPAFTYASLGNKDRALAWLDKAVGERNWCILYLKDDPVWDPLRSDPRFSDLLHRVGLPQ